MKTLTFKAGISDHRQKENLKKCFTVVIKILAIKGLKRNYRRNYSQCQILNLSILHSQKLVRNNNQPFITKTLHKAIMKRSKLGNKFNKEQNIENWSRSKYKIQCKLCLSLLKQSKKRHFNSLYVENVTENKGL